MTETISKLKKIIFQGASTNTSVNLEDFMLDTHFAGNFKTQKEKSIEKVYFEEYRYVLNRHTPQDLASAFLKSFLILISEFINSGDVKDINECIEYTNFINIKSSIVDDMKNHPAKYLGEGGEGMGF